MQYVIAMVTRHHGMVGLLLHNGLMWLTQHRTGPRILPLLDTYACVVTDAVAKGNVVGRPGDVQIGSVATVPR